MDNKCCRHQASFQSLATGLLAPGNSEAAVLRLSEMLELCRNCKSEDCPGIGELLIQATVLSAVDQCDEQSARPGMLDGLLPGAPLAEEG